MSIVKNPRINQIQLSCMDIGDWGFVSPEDVVVVGNNIYLVPEGTVHPNGITHKDKGILVKRKSEGYVIDTGIFYGSIPSLPTYDDIGEDLIKVVRHTGKAEDIVVVGGGDMGRFDPGREL